MPTMTEAIRAPGRPWGLREAAEYLGVSERTITRLAEAGKLKLIRLGTGRGRVLVPDAELHRLAEGK
jgi:excisionase family DNA binding protein